MPLPFSLPDAEFETLTASPPVAWLSQLRNCSDLKVHNWAPISCPNQSRQFRSLNHTTNPKRSTETRKS